MLTSEHLSDLLHPYILSSHLCSADPTVLTPTVRPKQTAGGGARGGGTLHSTEAQIQSHDTTSNEFPKVTCSNKIFLNPVFEKCTCLLMHVQFLNVQQSVFVAILPDILHQWFPTFVVTQTSYVSGKFC